MSDQGELEHRTAAHLQGAVGQEGTGKTRYTGRPSRKLQDDMMQSIGLGLAALHMIDFLPAWAIGGDQVDGPPFGKSRPFPADDAIECTDYTELPEEQLLLPSGEEQQHENTETPETSLEDRQY